jgi:hypothetical protein
MTPNPPSNSDGSSLPPKYRPNKGTLAKDTTETDLWAYDDLNLADEPAAESAAPVQPLLPAPRRFGKLKPSKAEAVPSTADSTTAKASAAQERIHVNVNKPKPPTKSADVSFSSAAKPDSEFDDLAHWEDSAPLAPEPFEMRSAQSSEREESLEPIAKIEVPPAKFSSPPPQAPAPQEENMDELSPVVREGATPVSLSSHLRLSNAERVGLIVLLAILLVGAAALVIFSMNRLPTESTRAAANDFPLKGGHLTVQSAASYWRQPVLEGANPDTFRRGTILIPVLTLDIADGTAGLRVIFRNQDGDSIGDIVTLSVQGGRKVEVPATAGFDDVGMHAAYRTGESKPWTAEVLEAPSADSPNNAFKRLFEMNVSTDRR